MEKLCGANGRDNAQLESIAIDIIDLFSRSNGTTTRRFSPFEKHRIDLPLITVDCPFC